MSNGIGKNPLNDISKVYVQQVVEKKKDDTYLEPDMKKRQANNEKARKDMEKMGTSMKNPHFESVEKSGWDAIKACSDGYNAVYDKPEVEEGYKTLPKEKMARQADKAYGKEVRAAAAGDEKETNKQMQRRIAMKDPAGRKAALKKEELELSGKFTAEEIEKILEIMGEGWE